MHEDAPTHPWPRTLWNSYNLSGCSIARPAFLDGSAGAPAALGSSTMADMRRLRVPAAHGLELRTHMRHGHRGGVAPKRRYEYQVETSLDRIARHTSRHDREPLFPAEALEHAQQCRGLNRRMYRSYSAAFNPEIITKSAGDFGMVRHKGVLVVGQRLGDPSPAVRNGSESPHI